MSHGSGIVGKEGQEVVRGASYASTTSALSWNEPWLGPTLSKTLVPTTSIQVGGQEEHLVQHHTDQVFFCDTPFGQTIQARRHA